MHPTEDVQALGTDDTSRAVDYSVVSLPDRVLFDDVFFQPQVPDDAATCRLPATSGLVPEVFADSGYLLRDALEASIFLHLFSPTPDLRDPNLSGVLALPFSFQAYFSRRFRRSSLYTFREPHV